MKASGKKVPMTNATSIFITNNGLSDHIGVAQVLPYLQGLARNGHDITVISVEDPAKWALTPPAPLSRDTDTTCAGALRFSPVFRRSGLIGRAQRFFVPMQMRKRLKQEMTKRATDLIHCRSYMPLGPSLAAAKDHNAALVCDVRGFWIDQRIEGGAWSRDNLRDRAKIAHFRKLEARAYAEAHQIVTLTEDAKTVIQAAPSYGGGPITVVPCSVDQDAFDISPDDRHRVRSELEIPEDALVVCYLGSSSGVYRMDLVNRVYDAARKLAPDARLLLMGNHTSADHARAAASHGVTLDEAEIITRKVPHSEVPSYLNAADIGLSFQVSTPSSLGVSATKVGEYMACGLPVASNHGVGDIERIVKDGQFGAVLRNDSQDEVDRVARVLVHLAQGADRAAIKAHGRAHYALTEAVSRYDTVYRAAAGQQ